MNRISTFAFNNVDSFINRKFRSAGLRKNVIETNNYSIEYWDSNNNKPVLLLIHGFGAEAKYQWFPQLKEFTKDYRVIVPDLLWFGKTTHKENAFTIEDQVQLINLLLSELSISKTNILGASYGGLIGIEFTKRYEAIVNHLLIQGSPIKYIYEGDEKRVSDHFKLNSVSDLFVPNDAKGVKVLAEASNSRKSFIPSFLLERFHQQFYTLTYSEKRKLMENLIGCREEYSNFEYNLKCKIDLIWGENDLIIPLDRGKLLNNHLGDNCNLHVIKKAGHMANLSKPKKFNRIVLDALKR